MKYILLFLISVGLSMGQAGAKSSETRGIRNNNPGNIVHTSKRWIGEIKCSDSRFKCFYSPLAGLKAMIRNLDAYYLKYNLSTVKDIVSRWSPSNENNTKKLITNITRSLNRLHVNVYDIRNSLHYMVLIRELIKQENGVVPFTDKYILEAINDTSRITNHGDQYTGRWSDDSLVSIYRIKEAGSFNTDKCYETRRGANTAGQIRQEPSVHKKDYSYLLSTCYNSLTQASRTLGHSCHLWVDRMAERVLVLYGRKGYSKLALSKFRGNPTDTSRHPLSLGYCWTLFWRKPYEESLS